MPEAGASLRYIIKFLWGSVNNTMIRGVPLLVSQDPTFNAWSTSIHKQGYHHGQQSPDLTIK
jgi:hypothetical protein